MLQRRDTLDVLEVPIHCASIKRLLLVPALDNGLITTLLSSLLGLSIAVLTRFKPVNLLLSGHFLSNDHFREWFLCLDPLQELFLGQFGVSVQVKSPYDGLAVVFGSFRTVVLEKAIQVPNVNITVAPVVDNRIDCFLSVIELGLKLLLKFLTLTV